MEYVRERVKRTCKCTNAGNRFITVPSPPQVMPKCKFSHNLLSLLIVVILNCYPLHFEYARGGTFTPVLLLVYLFPLAGDIYLYRRKAVLVCLEYGPTTDIVGLSDPAVREFRDIPPV